MSETPSHVPVKYVLPKWVRGPQDFIGGLAMVAIALFALWASSDLQGMHGFSFGAGTAPRMFAVLLLGLGIAVTVVGRAQVQFAGDVGGNDRAAGLLFHHIHRQIVHDAAIHQQMAVMGNGRQNAG